MSGRCGNLRPQVAGYSEGRNSNSTDALRSRPAELVAAQQTRDIEIAAGQENRLSKLINGIVNAPSRGISVAAASDDQSEVTARLFIFDVKP